MRRSCDHLREGVSNKDTFTAEAGGLAPITASLPLFFYRGHKGLWSLTHYGVFRTTLAPRSRRRNRLLAGQHTARSAFRLRFGSGVSVSLHSELEEGSGDPR